MCRWTAWLGQRVSMHELLFVRPRGNEERPFAPPAAVAV